MKEKYARGQHPNSRGNSPFKKGHAINVGRIMSEKTKEKIREAGKKKPKHIGWHHSKKTKEKISIAHLGEKNHQWNDVNPTYGAVHNWLYQYKNEKKKCEHCESKRFLEWALKKGETHSHSKEKYLVLCSSCHKKYDYTDARRLKMSIAMTGRKITWDLRPKKKI